MRTSQHVLFDFDADWPARPPLSLQRVARALRAQAVLIAVFAVGVALLVFAVSRTATDRYRATARLLATPSSLSSGGAVDDERSLTTSLALASTPAVRAAAARQVPGETPASVAAKITASVQTGAAVIDIVATDHNPNRAAAVANALAIAFLDERTKRTRVQIARTRALLTGRLDQLGPGAAATAEAATIRRRLGDLAAEQATGASDLRFGEPATAPSSAVSPRPARNAFAAFLVALALAVLAVIVREYPRPTKTVARKTDGLPVLARFPSKRRRRRAALRQRASAGENDARRSLLSAVLVALPPGRRHVVLTTSPDRGDRSARVAAELARSLARAGPRTLAFSADMASSALPRVLGSGGAPAADAREPEQRGAVDMPARAADVADDGYVVVDAPGLLTAPEPWLVGRYADAVVLVHPEGISTEELAAAREALDRLGARVLGTVITD